MYMMYLHEIYIYIHDALFLFLPSNLHGHSQTTLCCKQLCATHSSCDAPILAGATFVHNVLSKSALSWTTDPTEIRQFVCAFNYRPYCTMARTFSQPAFASTLKLAQRVVPFGPVTRQTIEGMSTLIEYLPTQTVAAPALGWVNFKAAFLTTSLGAGSFLTAIFGAAFFLGAACFLGVGFLVAFGPRH